MSYPTSVPNFKILGNVVLEKSLTEKKFIHTQTVTEKKKLYTVPYILCILIFAGNELKVYDIKQNLTLIF